MWGRIYPQIQNKKFQSPIRIYTDQCEYEPELARHPFIFNSDENCCQTLENTGHSFQVTGKGYSRKLFRNNLFRKNTHYQLK
jgi:hypothetical protein